MFRDFVNESKEFGKLEDNPLIYTLVIAKLANNCPDETKKDEVLKKAIEKAEVVAKQFDTKGLKAIYSPIGLFGVFEKANKADLKTYISQYYESFETEIANAEKSFAEAFKIHQAFKELKDSDEFKDFLKSL